MNSVMLAAEQQALLIDAGVLPSELDDIAAAVAAVAPRFENVALAFTHPHWDHVLALPWFPGATTFAHAGFHDELDRDAATIAADAEKWIRESGETPPQPFRPFTPTLTARGTALVDARTVRRGDVRYARPLRQPSRALAPGARHARGRRPALGHRDTVARRRAVGVPGEPQGLHWLFEQEDVRLLVPGHGPVAHGRVNGYRRLLRDMDYLLHLEHGVGEAWKRGWSLEETRVDLARMDYVGKNATYAMNDVHAENVRFAWQALADSAAPRRP
jgi:glyoxylase-like metal-dependent hydrolase (beta-lactamase superfamily II)